MRIFPVLVLNLVLNTLVLMPLNAQEQPPPAQPAQKPAQETPQTAAPQVRINYLNVCTPDEAEQKEMRGALDNIPQRPSFSADFEVSRGRTSLENAEPARYARLRRELSGKGNYSTAQYSLSTDAEKTTETLVLKVGEPKDLMMVALEDQVSATAVSPLAVLKTDTPVSRVKLERFGKPSLVLARCPQADQSVYEPIFRQASQLMAAYRKTLGLRSMFRSDLTWVAGRMKEKTENTTDAAKPETKAANKKDTTPAAPKKKDVKPLSTAAPPPR